ncbi:hypothetical protein [Paenibacillus sp. HGF7]|uniref:hypothetical protein n=1 Tax=Paenibacillus sp. HGF7 TaxID=944559 RepID=UPI00147939CC|nr:hypothetical protein [Paenibacillus sp. HGF7]
MNRVKRSPAAELLFAASKTSKKSAGIGHFCSCSSGGIFSMVEGNGGEDTERPKKK